MSECNHRLISTGETAIENGRCLLCNQLATLQPFEKMQPGDVDRLFQAICPKCDGRVWIFPALSGMGTPVIDLDARRCQICGYVHWLRGPNENKVIPLPADASAAKHAMYLNEQKKKDRVRALVFALIAAPNSRIPTGGLGTNRWPFFIFDATEVVKVASELDREIEATK